VDKVGSIFWVRSNAWIWDFSSTHNTIAFSGGAKYNPTTSLTLATSSGSVENLNVSESCHTARGSRSGLGTPTVRPGNTRGGPSTSPFSSGGTTGSGAAPMSSRGADRAMTCMAVTWIGGYPESAIPHW
jgi:hypothetical protein